MTTTTTDPITTENPMPTPRQITDAALALGDTATLRIVGPFGIGAATPDALRRLVAAANA